VPAPDPKFWEIPVPPEVFDAHEGSVFEFIAEGDPAPDGSGSARERLRRQAAQELRRLVSTSLTERQREIVELYFYLGRTQAEIAAELRISQQAVSRQLFGVLRNGRRVGGAIKRLRALCEAAGLDPDEWV
jgi:RNA polymerase sigma factor (sigma-70 family)